jgi:hypothetical protein
MLNKFEICSYLKFVQIWNLFNIKICSNSEFVKIRILFKSKKNVRVSDFEYILNLFISQFCSNSIFFQNQNLFKFEIWTNFRKIETKKKRHLDWPNKKVTRAERTPVRPRAERTLVRPRAEPRVYAYLLMTSSPKQGRPSKRTDVLVFSGLRKLLKRSGSVYWFLFLVSVLFNFSYIFYVSFLCFSPIWTILNLNSF